MTSVSRDTSGRTNFHDELCEEAALGEHDAQLITGLHTPWRKRTEPLAPSSPRSPGSPQEEAVHGRPAGLGPGPGEPEYGSQYESEPGEVALSRDRLQVEADAVGEADEETLWH